MPIEEKIKLHRDRGEIVPSRKLLKTPAQIEKIDNDLVAYTRDYLIEGYGPGGPASSRAMQDQGNSWWVLTACGALLGDLDLALREQTGLSITVAEDPLNCVALGTGSTIEETSSAACLSNTMN